MKKFLKPILFLSILITINSLAIAKNYDDDEIMPFQAFDNFVYEQELKAKQEELQKVKNDEENAKRKQELQNQPITVKSANFFQNINKEFINFFNSLFNK